MEASTVIFLTFGAYLVGLLGIGWWGDRRFGGSYAGFISADKSLGGWVAAISAAASSESGWLMLGLSGLGYRHGLGGYWAAAGCSFGFVITSIFVVRQLRRSAEGQQVLTLGDYIADHFGRGGRAIRSLSSLLIAFFLLLYVVAQFTSSGKQMAGMHLTSYRQGVVLGSLIIGIYVLIGGYAAVCWTDMVQGLLMVLILLAFPLVALVKAGGFGPVVEGLRGADLSSIWVGGAGPTSGAIGFALTYFGFSLGYPGMPHSIIRYITIRDAREARRAAWITSIYGTLVLFGSASLGVVGRVLMPGLADHEKILPAFTAAHFSPVISGVILAAVTAAIMSTADSQLMMAASALVHDVWRKTLGRESARGKLATRVVIGVLTGAALLLAMAESRVIDTLVLFAWGCLGAAFSPVIVLCLYWRRFTWQGAVASFVVGPATTVIWQVTGLSASLHGLIPGTALSVAAAMVVSLLTPDPRASAPTPRP